MREREVLLATLTDRVVISRADPKDPLGAPETVYEDLPCALSRSAIVTAPDPHDTAEALAECGFRATLFLPAGIWTRTGDRAEVRRENLRFLGVLSPSIPYPSHAVAVMRVQEVLPV